MERIKILVAFGDIREFTNYTRRTVPEEKRDFIRALYAEFQKMVRPSNYFIKYDGDGIMILKELKPSVEYEDIKPFMFRAYALAVKIRRVIDDRYPRPAGFVLRFSMGISFKIMVKNPYGGNPKLVPEYIDYPINLAKRLCEVHRDELAVCTGNIGEVIRKNDNGIILKPMDKPHDVPRGIDTEDVDDLFGLIVNDLDQH